MDDYKFKNNFLINYNLEEKDIKNTLFWEIILDLKTTNCDKILSTYAESHKNAYYRAMIIYAGDESAFWKCENSIYNHMDETDMIKNLLINVHSCEINYDKVKQIKYLNERIEKIKKDELTYGDKLRELSSKNIYINYDKLMTEFENVIKNEKVRQLEVNGDRITNDIKELLTNDKIFYWKKGYNNYVLSLDEYEDKSKEVENKGKNIDEK